MFSSRRIPLLASPPRSASAAARSLKRRRGGRAIQKISRSIRFSRGRGGVPIERTRNTTPPASIRRLLHHLFNDAATPPRGDARRGMSPFQNDASKTTSRVPATLDARLNDFREANLDRCVPSQRGECALRDTMRRAFWHSFHAAFQSNRKKSPTSPRSPET